MILHDQHMHSSFSFDSTEDLRNYFIKAKEHGCNYVMTCEHIDYFTSIDGHTWDCDFDALIEKQKELKKEFPTITPLLGIELGYRKDYLNEMNEISNKYDFDLIQLSIHDSGLHDYYYKSSFDKGIDLTMNEYYDLFIEGMDNFKNFDCLSHIGFGFKTAVMIDNSIKASRYEEQITKIYNKLISLNKPLEINCKVLETLNDIYASDINYKFDDHLRYMLSLYKKCGGTKLTLSSDAHDVSRYRLDFDKHISVIKECGFDSLIYFIKRKEYIYKI